MFNFAFFHYCSLVDALAHFPLDLGDGERSERTPHRTAPVPSDPVPLTRAPGPSAGSTPSCRTGFTVPAPGPRAAPPPDCFSGQRAEPGFCRPEVRSL